MVCPVCGDRTDEPHCRLTDRFFGAVAGEFELFLCPGCGLLFQDHDRVRARLADFYPPGYWWRAEGRLGRLEGSYRRWVVARDQLRFVLDSVPEPAGRKLLDVGCGNGTLVGLAQRAGFEAWGLEQSAEAVETAQQLAPGRVVHGTEDDLISEGRRFDVLVLLHCLEHVPDPAGYLGRLRGLLAEGGSLILQVPNRSSLQASLLGERWYGLDCPRHLSNFTARSLLTLLERGGWEVGAIRYYSLRDNAAALVSSLFPALDPMSQRVRALLDGRRRPRAAWLREGIYFGLTLASQPLAWLEAAVGRGATITVHARATI